MNWSRLAAAIVSLAAWAGLIAPSAEAQVRRCLVTASSAASVADYDPFGPTEINIANVAITFTRSNGPGGAKPSIIDMFVKAQSSAANGILLIPTSVVGAGTATGLGQNIFYNTPGPTPNIATPLGNTPVAGVLRWEYTGNNDASDVFTVNFTVKIPANLDLTASSGLLFDIEYGCNGTGGGPPFSERSTAPNAYSLSIHVKSALQASYVGSALDFGEIGDKTTADVLAAPSTYSTPPSGNHVRIVSSGPYKVELSSQNAFRLTYPGGNAGTAVQSVKYKALFLGQTVFNGSAAFAPVTCMRAGVLSAQADLLPIRATLLEGGDGKQVSPDYKDVITVTVSPLDSGVGVDCPGLALPVP